MRRNKVLLVDQDRRGRAINVGYVGQTVEVLVEGVSLRNAERWCGRTRTNKIVVFDPRPGLEAGDIVRVAVDRAMPQTLYGEIEWNCPE
jgi:tRNA-2-methylthio-N6-dimethylallyladenosine synthase